MTKHTKGPWEVESNMGRMCHVMTADGTAIADMAVEYSSVEDDREHEANARLIAAAPELLVWLRWALDRLNESARESGQHDMARAVVAKATGEQA